MRRTFPDRLARVRRVREIEERIARAAWGEAEARATEAEATRKRMRDELDHSRAALSRAMAGGSIDPTVALLEREALDTQLYALSVADASWMTHVAQAQSLAEAWKKREADRRALEELTKRALDRHRTELRKEENAEMDEIAAQRDARTRPTADRWQKIAAAPETGSSRHPWSSD